MKRISGLKFPSNKYKRNEDEKMVNVVKKCLVGSVVSNYQVSFSDRSRRFEFGILINEPTCNELPQKVDAKVVFD